MLRSLMTVSGFTLISRLLGFLRDILIARFLGTGLVADAFFAAFRFPNLFRRIFGEGAFNAAFVPLFGRKVAADHAGGIRFASKAFSMLFVVLGIFTLVAIPAMPLLMNLVVPGFKARDVDPSFFGKTTEIVLQEKGQTFEVGTKGARAMFLNPLEKGSLRVSEVSFASEDRGLGGLFGQKSAREVRRLGAPVSEEVALAGRYHTVLGPLTIELPPGLSGEEAEDFTEERAEEIKLIRQNNFVVEGFTWEEGVFVARSGADSYQFSRPRGKAGEDFRWFSLSLAGQGSTEIYRNDPGTFETTVKLARIMFIYLLCMALAAHLSGVLNTFRIFGMPAAAPVILNLVFLIALGFIGWRGWLPGETLAWAVAVAGFLQLAALWATCLKKGAPIKLVRPRLDREMKKLFALMGPGVASASVQQINLLIGGIIASFQPGAVSYLYYSDRVYQLPLGMIGIALGVVLLPEVTRQLQGGLERQAGKTITRGIELGMLLTLPAAAAMVVVPTELIAGLFQRGEFVRADAVQTGRALAAFALGLPGYVLIKVLQPGYFAKGDTKNPMKMALTMVLVNIVVSLLLFPWLGHVGLALATSIAAWVNVFMLWRGLHGFVVMSESVVFRLGRMVLCSLLMGVVLFFAAKGLAPWFEEGASWQRIGAMVILVSTGATAFGAFALFLRATSIQDLKAGFGKG
ncbi:murein biosynthesis integral membrane protein MurJ [Roseibacillus ishigakijimensis]|uniref:Probable lipid II flippase MurJ n=1 Tax=Roseibacillus ishigakijimensis TaxID=454146 RepID=A0A934VGE0_9BACT|nr:murein biosynthesis integral membrane protein MurJ [Roseibacillus ishigakijimensis]MBK1832758.1 murein biosynthesis integral membrane protein MurJ [Roseibacillus ishigakijimensis]